MITKHIAKGIERALYLSNTSALDEPTQRVQRHGISLAARMIVNEHIAAGSRIDAKKFFAQCGLNAHGMTTPD